MGQGLRVKPGREVTKHEPEVAGDIAFMVKRVLGTMMAQCGRTDGWTFISWTHRVEGDGSPYKLAFDLLTYTNTFMRTLCEHKGIHTK